MQLALFSCTARSAFEAQASSIRTRRSQGFVWRRAELQKQPQVAQHEARRGRGVAGRQRPQRAAPKAADGAEAGRLRQRRRHVLREDAGGPQRGTVAVGARGVPGAPGNASWATRNVDKQHPAPFDWCEAAPDSAT